MPGPGLIVLAAGGSTRMGRPKQLLPWKQSTLLRHACETALGTALRPVIVVLGCEAEACHAEVEDLDVTPVINPEWTRGMGRSVSTGVAALMREVPLATGALIMLVDQPRVTVAFLEELVGLWSPTDKSIAATAYAHGGGVPAIFARSYFPELLALDGDRGARSLIEREAARVSLLRASCDLADLDTPEAYQAHVQTED